jgi:hypothetical protein
MIISVDNEKYLRKFQKSISNLNNLTTRIKIYMIKIYHTCNSSYSGGRDQEDHSSKPAQANSL